MTREELHAKLCEIRKRLVAAARADDLVLYRQIETEHRKLRHAHDPALKARWEARCATL